MKFIIIYYSHYGNTAKLAHKFFDFLKEKYDVEIFQLEYRGGEKSTLVRFFYRLMPFLVSLEPLPFDLKNYDVLFLGIPVLFGHPSSAIIKYLRTCKNIEGKIVVCFYVYSLELSFENCRRIIESILRKKKVYKIIDINLKWFEIGNEGFLGRAIRETLQEISPSQ